MQLQTVERNGEPDFVFKGELLAVAREAAAPSDPNHWELRLFKTANLGYVLASSFHITDGGNRSLHTATRFASIQGLKEFLALDMEGSHHPPAGTLPAKGALITELMNKAAQKDPLCGFFVCPSTGSVPLSPSPERAYS
ncbi:MAG: hypothetical protein D6E12_10985 [Desulfovibrio sp.]|nr:MAG: hypothetical protein D6E12_10985 [Desulfovibrio sp.]